MGSDFPQHNLTVKYQFQLDGQPAGPLHDDWDYAALDAVAAGFARWLNPHELELDTLRGAWIMRVRVHEELPVPAVAPAAAVPPSED